ncbi:hypothetical protein NL676_005947 [Syzygium grande]|nr:hypothetical protein NL676_005947 [Syzygium grande]
MPTATAERDGGASLGSVYQWTAARPVLLLYRSLNFHKREIGQTGAGWSMKVATKDMAEAEGDRMEEMVVVDRLEAGADRMEVAVDRMEEMAVVGRLELGVDRMEEVAAAEAACEMVDSVWGRVVEGASRRVVVLGKVVEAAHTMVVEAGVLGRVAVSESASSGAVVLERAVEAAHRMVVEAGILGSVAAAEGAYWRVAEAAHRMVVEAGVLGRVAVAEGASGRAVVLGRVVEAAHTMVVEAGVLGRVAVAEGACWRVVEAADWMVAEDCVLGRVGVAEGASGMAVVLGRVAEVAHRMLVEAGVLGWVAEDAYRKVDSLGREVEDVHRRVEEDVRGREEEEEDAFGREVSLETVVEGIRVWAAEDVSEMAVEGSHRKAVVDSAEGPVDTEEVVLVGEFGVVEGTKEVDTPPGWRLLSIGRRRTILRRRGRRAVSIRRTLISGFVIAEDVTSQIRTSGISGGDRTKRKSSGALDHEHHHHHHQTAKTPSEPLHFSPDHTNATQ